MNKATNAPELTNSERFIAWTANQSAEPCRRWSYEIEAVGLGGASYALQNLGFDTHNDPSITDADECQCDCGDCQHSCDCDNCSITNGWDSEPHCSECSDTEAAPSDYRPVKDTHDTDRLAEACQALRRAGADIDDTCGGHVHVDAQDLSAQQVAKVMKLWRKVEEFFPDLIGREANRYAEEITERDLEDITAEYPSAERYRAVNALNWINGRHSGRKATIEFRQFAGTLDPQVIIARGYICRALVEYAKSDRPVYWLLASSATPERFLADLGLSTL